MKLLVFSICVSLSSAAYFQGLQTDRNGAITSIAKQSVGAALANHLATKGNAYGVAGNTQGIVYGVATPVGAGNIQGISYGVGIPVVTGYNQGITYGVASPVAAGNTKGISYAAGTPVVASQVNAGNSLYAAAPVAATGAKYSGPLNQNKNLVDYPNGAKVPAEEPAVAAAR